MCCRGFGGFYWIFLWGFYWGFSSDGGCVDVTLEVVGGGIASTTPRNEEERGYTGKV